MRASANLSQHEADVEAFKKREEAFEKRALAFASACVEGGRVRVRRRVESMHSSGEYHDWRATSTNGAGQNSDFISDLTIVGDADG